MRRPFVTFSILVPVGRSASARDEVARRAIMSFILSAIGVLEYLRVHKFAMPSSRFAYFLRARLSVECGNSSTKLLLSRDLKHCNRCSGIRGDQPYY